MHISDAIFKGVLVGLFMAISVGPTLFAIIKYSLNFSYKAGLAFVLGVSISDALYVTIANIAASWLRYQLVLVYNEYPWYGVCNASNLSLLTLSHTVCSPGNKPRSS